MYPSLLAALLYAFAASKASRYSGLTGAELSQNQQIPHLTLVSGLVITCHLTLHQGILHSLDLQ